MKTISLKLATIILAIIISSCQGNSKAETTSSKENTPKEIAENQIQVIQFHSENRCMTCNKIEALTLETLKSHPELEFKLVNVDDAKNEKIATAFEATGTALYLYNPKTNAKLDLTDFAFMNAGDEEKFKLELNQKVNEFIQ